MINIVLCGGSGSRLWPLSREQHPKQFCSLITEHSLFQETLLRNRNICEKFLIATNIKQYSLANIQLKELSLENKVIFLLEPVGRNTAPAITIACLALNPDDIVFVSPSDHHIQGGRSYIEMLQRAKILADVGYLVTFGIKPSRPEIGFGYIEAAGEDVISFHEKPDAKTSQEYVQAGNYFWNSGMFVFKVKTYLDELKTYSKNIYDESLDAFENRECSNKVIQIPKDLMEKISAISIDYAVMEKSKKIKMLASDINWSDLGSFEAIYSISNQDVSGNVSTPKNILFSSKNNLIISEDKPVVLIEVDDLIVVNTPDAILISKKGSSHKIKEILPGNKTSDENKKLCRRIL